MKYNLTLVGPLGFKHELRLTYLGLLEVLVSIMDLKQAMGLRLQHLSPEVVAMKPQLALPHYPQ